MDPNFEADTNEKHGYSSPWEQEGSHQNQSEDANANGHYEETTAQELLTQGARQQSHLQSFGANADINASSPSFLTLNAPASLAMSPNDRHAPTTAHHFSSPTNQPMPATSAKVESASDGQPYNNAGYLDAPPQDLIVPRYPSTSPSGSGIDVQALLDDITTSSNLSTAPAASTMNVTSSQFTASLASDALAPISNPAVPSLPDIPTLPVSSHANLPPRPPLQASPSPAVQNTAARASHTAADTNSGSPVSVPAPFAPLANAAPPPLPTAGAPGVQAATPASMPPPPLPTLPNPQSPFPGLDISTQDTISPASKQDSSSRYRAKTGIPENENLRWSRETQTKYDEFMNLERHYVLEGSWEKFPSGSRLFLGKVPRSSSTYSITDY